MAALQRVGVPPPLAREQRGDALKERGILFSAALIQPILADVKKQTRRAIVLREFQPSKTPGYDWTFRDNRGLWQDFTIARLIESKFCPFHVGNRLWVKEAWDYFGGDEYLYQADAHAVIYRERDECLAAHTTRRWRSPICMPRWAARITLEVTTVSVQRLHDISEADACAEGVEPYTPPHGCISLDQRVPGPGFDSVRLGDQPHRLPFADLWDRLNGKRSPWERNPWIWALTFARVP
jgi:hypothetical protein